MVEQPAGGTASSDVGARADLHPTDVALGVEYARTLLLQGILDGASQRAQEELKLILALRYLVIFFGREQPADVLPTFQHVIELLGTMIPPQPAADSSTAARRT